MGSLRIFFDGVRLRAGAWAGFQAGNGLASGFSIFFDGVRLRAGSLTWLLVRK